jgi:alpha-tubulin suppressor-like RCC1 family protein
VLRGVASNLSDSASVTVVADSGAVRLEARSVHTGGGFTCAVRLDNRIVCWGSSWYGELGNGAVRKFTATLSPVPIATTESLHSLQSGWNHSCALDATNRAWCWGVNVARQISDAQVSQYPLPELFANGRTFSSIAPGGSVTCGLSSGIIACKGAGLSGIEEFSAARPLMSLRAGALHVCAVDDSQHIWCRGDNLRGQLGVATTPYSHQLIAVDTAHTYLTVSLGPSNTCGLTTERTVRCWGYGENGELGTGDRRSSVDPVDVPLPAPAVQISVGGRSVCALLITQYVYCWGYNLDGGLGNGTPPRSPTTDDLVFPSPVPVATALRFKQVAASRGGAACGISLSDVVYCWGKNLEGAVGAGRHATTQLWPEQSFFWIPTLVRSVAP